ncbi:hypothetical protein D3C85_1304800 [compost metagenome]
MLADHHVRADITALIDPAVGGRVVHHGGKIRFPLRIARVLRQEAQHGWRQSHMALVLAPPDPRDGVFQPFARLRIGQHVQPPEVRRMAQRDRPRIAQIDLHLALLQAMAVVLPTSLRMAGMILSPHSSICLSIVF